MAAVLAFPKANLVVGAVNFGSSRPFTTYYYEAANPTNEGKWARIGRAKSMRGAVRTSVVRLFDRNFGCAVICNEAGICVGRIFRDTNGIRCVGC